MTKLNKSKLTPFSLALKVCELPIRDAYCRIQVQFPKLTPDEIHKAIRDASLAKPYREASVRYYQT